MCIGRERNHNLQNNKRALALTLDSAYFFLALCVEVKKNTQNGMRIRFVRGGVQRSTV